MKPKNIYALLACSAMLGISACSSSKVDQDRENLQLSSYSTAESSLIAEITPEEGYYMGGFHHSIKIQNGPTSSDEVVLWTEKKRSESSGIEETKLYAVYKKDNAWPRNLDKPGRFTKDLVAYPFYDDQNKYEDFSGPLDIQISLRKSGAESSRNDGIEILFKQCFTEKLTREKKCAFYLNELNLASRDYQWSRRNLYGSFSGIHSVYDLGHKAKITTQGNHAMLSWLLTSGSQRIKKINVAYSNRIEAWQAHEEIYISEDDGFLQNMAQGIRHSLYDIGMNQNGDGYLSWIQQTANGDRIYYTNTVDVDSSRKTWKIPQSRQNDALLDDWANYLRMKISKNGTANIMFTTSNGIFTATGDKNGIIQKPTDSLLSRSNSPTLIDSYLIDVNVNDNISYVVFNRKGTFLHYVIDNENITNTSPFDNLKEVLKSSMELIDVKKIKLLDDNSTELVVLGKNTFNKTQLFKVKFKPGSTIVEKIYSLSENLGEQNENELNFLNFSSSKIYGSHYYLNPNFDQGLSEQIAWLNNDSDSRDQKIYFSAIDENGSSYIPMSEDYISNCEELICDVALSNFNENNEGLLTVRNLGSDQLNNRGELVDLGFLRIYDISYELEADEEVITELTFVTPIKNDLVSSMIDVSMTCKTGETVRFWSNKLETTGQEAFCENNTITECLTQKYL